MVHQQQLKLTQTHQLTSSSCLLTLTPVLPLPPLQAVLQVLKHRWLAPRPSSPLGRFISSLVEAGTSGGAKASGAGGKGRQGAAVPLWLARSGQLLRDIMEHLGGPQPQVL